MDVFIQTEGNSKGNEVEVIKEDAKNLTVRSIATDFIYSVSLRASQRCYKRKENDNS